MPKRCGRISIVEPAACDGTNYPMIMPAKALEGIDALGLDQEATEPILAGNAQRIYRLSA